MDFPTISAVTDSADTVAFNFDFALQGKALEDGSGVAPVVRELDDGDLIIAGWAADFSGIDRAGENFTDGAFQHGIKSFLSGPSPLCFHHKSEKCLGKVLKLNEVEGKGLWMEARVDGAIRQHPELGAYYGQIKNGTLTGLSVGGLFGRKMTSGGPRISKCDFVEISVTPTPMHSSPSFEVIAGKALELGADEEPTEAVVLPDFTSVLDSIGAAFDGVEGKATKAPKGDYDDLVSLALILALEQQTNTLDDDPENDGDAKVDALIEKVKTCLDEVAKEAHSLASKLGPLPKISWNPEGY